MIAVAHPDDETIFFAGLIRRLVESGHRVDVACATSRFASSFLTSTRRAELSRACWQLGARPTLLGFDDAPGPLPEIELVARLRGVERAREYESVFTHGIWGEYGHRHHRDVCLAAHRAFGDRTYSLAGPLEAELDVALSAPEVEAKRRLARTVYYSQPSAATWCSSRERFARLPADVTEVLIAIANGDGPPTMPTAPGRGVINGLATRCRAAFESDSVPSAEVANIPAELWMPTCRQFASSLRSFAGAAPPRQ